MGLVALFAAHERSLFHGVGSMVGRLRWGWVGAAVAAQFASMLPLAEAQLVVLGAGGERIARWRVVLVVLARTGISMIVPAGLGVAEGYAYTKYRRYGVQQAIAGEQ